MNELIPINYNNDRPTVSARELHEFLEVDTPYHKWFPRMCEYGFVEKEDFSVADIFVHNSNGGPQSIKDAQLTIDMAKELCMIQRTEKGKQARQYFLSVEKAWNDPTTLMARALKMADIKISGLSKKIEQDAPKVLFADSVQTSDDAILVGELAKIIKQNGVDIGQNRLFEWMREHHYLIGRAGTDRNTPTQRSMEMGLFFIKERTTTDPSGEVKIRKTPYVTGKGQQYFVNKFLAPVPA